MDTGTIINLVISGIVALFVIFGMYWGLVRGLRRTAIRSVWLLVTAGILVLFLSNVITNAIMNAEYTITVDGMQFSGFKDVITYYVESSSADLSALGESLDVIVQTIFAYVAIILNSFIFVILFWLLKMVLLPLNWALSKWVFIGKKERQYRKDMKAYKAYIKQYNKLNKGKAKVDVMAFAVNDEDKKLTEDDIKEIKEDSKLKKNLDSLHSARKAFDDLVIRTHQQKSHKELKEVESEHNELLDRPYVEKKKVEEVEEVVQEEYTPKEEYNPEEEKQEEVTLQPVAKPVKPSRHRIWGMLLGGVMGLFVSAITLSPVIGIMNLADEINNDNEITLDDNTKQGIVDYITQGMFSEINEYYRGSIGANALKYTGTEWVATETFKALTKANINGVNADLTKDAVAIVSVVNEINILSSNWTKAQENNYDITTLSKIINSAEKIVDNMFEISIIDLLTPHLIDLVVDVLEDQATTSEVAIRLAESENVDTTQDEIELDTNKLLLQIAKGLQDVENTENLKKELKSLVNLLRILNSGVSVSTDNGNVSTSLLCEMLKQSNGQTETDLFAVIQKINFDYYNRENKYYFTQLIDGVYVYEDYTPKVATSIMPTAMDYLFKLVLAELDLGSLEVSFDEINNTTMQTMLADIFDETFSILLHFNTIKDNDGNYIFRELNGDTSGDLELADINISVFRSLGKILDSLTTPFTTEEYSDLMSSLGASISDTLKPIFTSLMSENRANILSSNVRIAMSTITKEEGLAGEFEAIGVLFNYLITGESIIDENGKIVEVEPMMGGQYFFDESDSWELKLTNLSGIGNVLEAMQGLKIFGYLPEEESGITVNNTTYFFDSVIDKFKTDIETSIIEEGLLDTITNLNDKGYIESSSITSINQVLWNCFTRIQKNLNSGVEKSTGAFDWKGSLTNKNTFFEFLEMIMEETGSESNQLFEIGSENNILKLLVSDKYTTTYIGAVTQTYSVFDEIADSPLLTNVVRNILLDMRSFLTNSLTEDDNMELKDELESVIKELLTTMSAAEDNKTTYYSYLLTLNNAIDNAINNGLIVDGSFELTIDSVDSVASFGAFLDDLTSTVDQGAAVLSDATVAKVIQSVIDSEMLAETTEGGVTYSSKLASMIKDETISKPLEDMLKVVKNNFNNGSAIYNSNYGTWENIFGALIKVSNTNFAGMENTTDALNTMGSILDILTGKPFKLRDGENNTISIPFMDNVTAKKCLIGLVANKMSDGTIEDSTILDVIYSVKTASNKALLDAMALKVKIDTNTYEGVFTHYDKTDFVGVLENVYIMEISDWTAFCTELANDIDNFTSLQNADPGQFSDPETYTYYKDHENNYAGLNGIEFTINEMIDRQYSILTIDHIKYLLKSKIVVSDTAKDFVKEVAKDIKANVDSLENEDVVYEFKAIKYFLDFTGDVGVSVPDMGVYMDELENSKLLGNMGKTNIGETIAIALLTEIDKDTIIKKSAAEEINNYINEQFYKNGNQGNQYLTMDTDGEYKLNTTLIKEYINEYYTDELGNKEDMNADLFKKLMSIQEKINNSTGA